jgi:hypothetical protein
LESESARPELADCRARLATASADLQAMLVAMTGYLMGSQQDARELYRLGLESARFLLAVGDVLIGWMLLQHAELALGALDTDTTEKDRAYYAGKIATARFFAESVLPRLSSDRKVVESVTLGAMDLPEESF